MEKKYDVTVIGLQVVDLVVSKVDSRILERDLTTVESVKMMLGGDAVNQALVLSKIGARTGIMGVTGSDSLGDMIISRLAGDHIAVFTEKEDINTAVSIVLVDEKGERHFVYQPSSNEVLAYRHVNEDAVRASKVLSIAGSMGLSGLDGEDTLRLLRLARESGTITAVDFKIARDSYDMDMIRQEIALCDYVLPSELEARYITGEEEPEKQAAAFHAYGARHVVIKLGDRGCYVSSDEIKRMAAPYPCSCIDSTGAGDTFSGAFLYGVSRGWDILQCARFGNAAGSIAVEHAGANQAIRDAGQIYERMNRTISPV